MLEFNEGDKTKDVLITRGEHAGRMYYCQRPFFMGGGRYYLGGNLDDWIFMGGGTKLPPIVLKQYVDEIVQKRKDFLVNWVLQHQDEGYAIADFEEEDGTWLVGFRKNHPKQTGASKGDSGSSDLPSF